MPAEEVADLLRDLTLEGAVGESKSSLVPTGFKNTAVREAPLKNVDQSAQFPRVRPLGLQ